MRFLFWWWLICLPLAAEVVLEVGHTGHSQGVAEQVLSQLMRAWRGPSLTLRIAPPRTDLETLQALQDGDLQLALVRSSLLVNYHRRWGVTSLAYQWEEPDAFLKGPQGQQLLQLRLDDLSCLGVIPLGPRLLASDRPLSRWEQLRGRTVLTSQNRFLWETFLEVGAHPVCVTALSLPERLEHFPGAVCDLTWNDYQELGLRQRLPYLWNPGYANEWLVLVANSRALARLSTSQLERLRGPLLDRKAYSVRASQAPPIQKDGDPFRSLRERALRLCGGGL